MQNGKRGYRLNHLEDANCRNKIANAARELMSPTSQFQETSAYNHAEALVDALVDYYGIREGELPFFGQDRHGREVARRLEHLEKAVRAYRQAFEEGAFSHNEGEY